MRKALIFAVAGMVFASETTEPDYRYPIACVPYAGGAPPKIDGVVTRREYKNFSAITGMVKWPGSGEGRTLVPKIQQVVWYLGYDDEYFYITMHSPNPPGVWPLARVKQNDNHCILWDDHTEIQMAKERSRATFPGVGFYKIMVNPRGYYTDEWFFNGTPGTEGEWSLAGPVKCSVTKEYWDMEIAIDLRALDEKRLDGKRWVLQLLRADKPGGIYFAGWVGEAWMSWNRFGEVLFSRTAPIFRFLDTGELAKGDMKLVFELRGQTKRKIPVDIRVSVIDGNGKLIYREKRREYAQKSRVRKIIFEKELALTEKENTIEILATYDSNILYHFQAPIIKLTGRYYDQHIAPWLALRPKGDFQWRFAYLPSYAVAEAGVDLDFFGIEDGLKSASSFEVSVLSKHDGKVVVLKEAPIEKKKGYVILKNLDLPEGDYTARVRLFARDGKTVVGEKSIDFLRRHYDWEGNSIGKANTVIPPYTPVRVRGKEMELWARHYTIGENGLLRRIVAGGGAGKEDILTSPMEFVAVINGEEARPEECRSEVVKLTEARVDVRSAGVLGDAKYRVDAYLEFDGWYQVELTLSPAKEVVAFQSLSLRIPLWSDADTMYIQRAGDLRRGNKFGALPGGEGLIWQSSSLIPRGNWGSFCPVVFVGTGDKGLWWFAEENRSWTMSKKKSAVEIFRNNKGIELRFNIFAEEALLTEPRKVVFAFLIDPVKQIPEERKWAWGKLRYAHNTYGYRYWGRSVDGYENTDKDLEALKRVLTDPNWRMPAYVEDGHSVAHITAFRSRFFKAVAQQGLMLTLYGSTSLTGLGLPAFDTYGGEWLGRTNWKPNPQTEFKRWWNLQCTHQWMTPREMTTVCVNFTRSYEDCFVWHHYRLISKVPVNGTWWDNSSLSVIRDYDPEKGEFYRRFNVFTRRRLTKRLATMGWKLGRRPWWINNMHVDWSFCQVSWHIENDFYIDNEDMTMMDQLSVDEFRAMCRIKRGIIHRLASRGPAGTTEQMRRMGRSQVGMCLLHDIGSYNWGFDRYYAPAMLKVLERNVGFFDGAEFIPYWRNKHLIKISTPGVYASVYRGKGKAVIVVVNTRREDIDVRFELGKGILEKKKFTRLYDAETGEEFRWLWDRKLRRRVLGELKPGVFGMPWGSVRLLVVE